MDRLDPKWSGFVIYLVLRMHQFQKYHLLCNKLSCSNPHSDYSGSYEFSSEEELLPSPGLSSLEKIKDLETELKSVKKHCDDRLNQLENRFTNLEDRLYEPNYPNDPDYRPLY